MTARKAITHIVRIALVAGVTLVLIGVAQAANIDTSNKYAWGTNAGWINFNPTRGGGVTVYSDHLEGYAWGENVGWIRLGTTTGGSPYTYANDAAGTYGVNNDGVGNVDGIAWGTNVGWINFNPTHGGGVTVYSDHLEGYAWGENIGWIRLGTCSGSSCTHANTTAANYGVNNDGVGNLSGYAWGTNVGWINFNPTHSQVTIDPATGSFDGYAWGENIGWIHFKNTDPAYYVVTSFRPVEACPGDLTGDHQVGSDDIELAASGWRKHPGEDGYDARVDRNGDDTITVDEIQWFAAQWGSCG